MGLLQKCLETYDTFASQAGEYRAGEEPLAPVGHITTFATIEIQLNAEGGFVSAQAVDKDEGKIIIPATEGSMSRTSKAAELPHPLCEQLKYLTNRYPTEFSCYVNQLQRWVDSPYGHPMLMPILAYVRSGTIIHDLLDCDLIKLDDKGALKNEKEFIRWRVSGLNDGDETAVWKNRSLMDAFSKFYLGERADGQEGNCAITGEAGPLALQHLKGAVSLNGNAKLVSANDSVNFTYRGRFLTDAQAVTVGYCASQKAHNALKWLIANQHVYADTRAFICWNPKGMKVANATDPLMSLAGADVKVEPTEYKEMLKKVLSGYKTELPENEDVIIASFDAATTGRLALTYYNELRSGEFYDRLFSWDEWCCFPYRSDSVRWPSLYQIMQCAFGLERNSKLDVNDKLSGQIMQSLIAARVDGQGIPSNIVKALIVKASSPLSYKTTGIWQRVVFTACAVIRKYRHDKYGEEWNMALEPDKLDRSYQYGRLLALLEKAEKDTYPSGTDRDPNAIRMLAVFCQRPQYASSRIMEQLKRAYMPRLKAGSRAFYEKQIGSVYEKLSEFDEAELNRPLSDTYLMGYYLQKNELYTANDKKEENENGNFEQED